ncbi:glycosyltransferase family 39 protein [Candidatus Curtissbacteria bacterium]|nr:glycosyltransferase family 39 protein [Candidatus Curtissbacteria bacterium]
MFAIFAGVIIVSAIFFRFFDYFERILIHSDHSLFAQAAIFSAKTFSIPQIGPFAQSSFFTGPWWLWILGIFYLFPFGVLGPWYFMSIFSLVFIFLIYIVGREIGGRWLGALAALLAGISRAQIDNSLSLWNAAADPLFAAGGIYFLIKFYQSKKAIYVLFLSFTVGLATTIHFQAGLLLPLVLVALVTSRPKARYFISAFLGLLIPFVPFLIFDLRFSWFWAKSVLIYITVDQYRFWVPNRWLTYAFDYWPTTWGYILGVGKWLGFLIIGLLSILTILRLREAPKFKIFFLLALSFFLEVVMYRYWGGQRFVYFSNFAQPAVFIFTAWVIVELSKIARPLSAVLAIVIFSLAFKTSIINLKPPDITVSKISHVKSELFNNFDGENFDIYGCSFGGALISHPLALFIWADGRNRQDGEKIGVCYLADKTISWHVLTEEEIADRETWLNHSTENTYRTMTEWWKTNPPK